MACGCARPGHAPSPGKGSYLKTWRYVADIPDSDVVRRAERLAIRDQGLVLRERRHKADYRPGARLAATEAHEALREAQGIVKAFDRLKP